jgi:hypothetical protein
MCAGARSLARGGGQIRLPVYSPPSLALVFADSLQRFLLRHYFISSIDQERE